MSRRVGTASAFAPCLPRAAGAAPRGDADAPALGSRADESVEREHGAIVASLESLAATAGDDVRGIVPRGAAEGRAGAADAAGGSPLLPGAAVWIGAAFRAWLSADGGRGIIAVGRDPRVSSPAIAAAFRRGAGGCAEAGLATTPAMLEWLLRPAADGSPSPNDDDRGVRLGAAMVSFAPLWFGVTSVQKSGRISANRSFLPQCPFKDMRLLSPWRLLGFSFF